MGSEIGSVLFEGGGLVSDGVGLVSSAICEIGVDDGVVEDESSVDVLDGHNACSADVFVSCSYQVVLECLIGFVVDIVEEWLMMAYAPSIRVKLHSIGQ